MTTPKSWVQAATLPRFDRRFFESEALCSAIGRGGIGGKAAGLVFVQDALATRFGAGADRGMSVSIPRLVVLATDVFQAFVERNRLHRVVEEQLPDDRVAHAFLQASLPAEVLGDLRALVNELHTPLAVRSSSLLEDAMYHPFAGVYGTKMVPNNQHASDARFQKLMQAIKLVYASAYFRAARDYVATTGRDWTDERMAVVLQQVVGMRHGDRFYPHLSGVGRSYSYYPTADAKPSQGVVDLALGLGKTIVDGGVCWTYCPAYPRRSPPVASPAELLQRTQTKFWAVNMGRAPAYDPLRETEYLVRCDLDLAEQDGVLPLLVSTYRGQDDRMVLGLADRGPRVLTFAPLLQLDDVPLNAVVTELLEVCEQAVGSAVEIEFAVTLGEDRGQPAHLGFLQVRPMVVSSEQVTIDDEELDDARVLVASERAMGNGVRSDVADVVYVVPEAFDAKDTPVIASELEGINRTLVEAGRPYLLLGFGRWGSSDPWLGIPVIWSQIAGAKAIVEATLPTMNVELSQGSHFFHNITSFRVSYFQVDHALSRPIDWDWLAQQPAEAATDHVRHVRLTLPLTIKVDGLTGRGVIRR